MMQKLFWSAVLCGLMAFQANAQDVLVGKTIKEALPGAKQKHRKGSYVVTYEGKDAMGNLGRFVFEGDEVNGRKGLQADEVIFARKHAVLEASDDWTEEVVAIFRQNRNDSTCSYSEMTYEGARSEGAMLTGFTEEEKPAKQGPWFVIDMVDQAGMSYRFQ